jgi:hypothetical protein
MATHVLVRSGMSFVDAGKWDEIVGIVFSKHDFHYFKDI